MQTKHDKYNCVKTKHDKYNCVQTKHDKYNCVQTKHDKYNCVQTKGSLRKERVVSRAAGAVSKCRCGKYARTVCVSYTHCTYSCICMQYQYNSRGHPHQYPHTKAL